MTRRDALWVMLPYQKMLEHGRRTSYLITRSLTSTLHSRTTSLNVALGGLPHMVENGAIGVALAKEYMKTWPGTWICFRKRDDSDDDWLSWIRIISRKQRWGDLLVDRDNEEVDHEHQEPCRLCWNLDTWQQLDDGEYQWGQNSAQQRQQWPLILITFQFHVISYGYNGSKSSSTSTRYQSISSSSSSTVLTTTRNHQPSSCSCSYGSFVNYNVRNAFKCSATYSNSIWPFNYTKPWPMIGYATGFRSTRHGILHCFFHTE